VDLVLGTAQLTRPYGVLARSQVTRAEDSSQSLVGCAEDLGFSAIDTAPVYGDAEVVLGSVRTHLQIHTKFHKDLSAENSVRSSLTRLRRSSLEIVYFHERLDREDYVKRVPETRERLDPEVVRNLGVSIYELDECLNAVECQAVSAIQFPFHVFDRRFRPDIFKDFIDRGGRVFVRSIFLQGLLLASSVDFPRRLAGLIPFLDRFWRVCREHGVEPLRAALWFAHHYHPRASLIIGTRSVIELTKIVETLSFVVPDGFIDALANLDEPEWAMVDPRNW